MFWADSVGLDKVLSTIRRFGDELGPQYWAPAPLLVSLAGAGKKLADLPREARVV